VRTDGVGPVVIHKTHARFYSAKLLSETLRAAPLVPHAEKMQRGIQNVQIICRHFPSGETSQVVAKRYAGVWPAKAHLVQLGGRHSGKIETSLNRQARKTRVVFYPAEAFFRDSEKQFSVAYDACGGIVHLRVVDAERKQVRQAPAFVGVALLFLRSITRESTSSMMAQPVCKESRKKRLINLTGP
jgi:hypothetical protein